MKQLKWLAAGLALAITAPLAAAGRTGDTKQLDAAAAFARLKTLEGTWEAPVAGGRKARSTFELTAGGTVLLERYENPAMPGGGRMATAYFIEDGALVLTHYCVARNQPMMRAERFDAATGQVQFEFLRAANLANADAGHMRRAMYRLDSPNQFTTSWEFFEKGARVMTETATFTRITASH